MMNKWISVWMLVMLVAVAAALATDERVQDAEALSLQIDWARDTPQAIVALRAPGLTTEPGEWPATLALFGASGRRYWEQAIRVPLVAAGMARAVAEIQLPAAADAPYRMTASVALPEFGIEGYADAHFADRRAPVRWYGIRLTGHYPDTRIGLGLALQSPGDLLEVDVTVRDRELNQVMRKTERYRMEAESRVATIDVTPPPQAIGPFTVEYEVVNETGSLHFRHTQRFAVANALIPLTSMQSDRLPDWYRSTYTHPRGFNRYSLTFNSQDIIEPATFDIATYRSGGRALRLDYRAGTETHVYSDLILPGFPVRVHVWVKGNQSQDELVVYFRDRCETARWQHERYVNRGEQRVGTLDFEGWRRFEVPVLGRGLQTASRHESQQAIATPIHMLAFTVRSPKLEDDAPVERTIWIDDLAVETQTAPANRITLDLRTDTPDARLHDDARLFVAIGNGTGGAIVDGRLHVLARDRDDQDVFERTVTLDVDADAFGFAEIPLADLAAVQPLGPVRMEATVVAPGAGLRVRQSLVLKAARHAAVFWDFERPDRYSGYGDAPGAETAPGGADGTAHALSIPVVPGQDNTVILHPALPGIPSHIEMMVKGGDRPARLRPAFLDAGRTGVSGMAYNKLQTPEILVDWQGWRQVRMAAPSIPVGYDTPDRQFLFEPAYPINLILVASGTDEHPTTIGIDTVRVHTHVPDAEAVMIDLVGIDDAGVLKPEGPLAVRLLNFHAGQHDQLMHVQVVNAHQEVLLDAEQSISLPPGVAAGHVLVDRLPEGIYVLSIHGVGSAPRHETLVAKDLEPFFGADPEARLADLQAIEINLGMAERRIYLDWDNLEQVPGLIHFDWFHNELAKASVGDAYRVVPVLGFSADWAGPEKWEAVQQGAYERFIGNHMQVPVRLVDWSRYIREAVREFAGHAAAWEFWENPDFRGSPAYIPPDRYRDLLTVVRRWVDVYDPGTPVIAGGFSYDHIYDYLSAVPDAYTLPFDRLGIQFSIGELSPEAADMEGLLDDLDALLKLDETGRDLDIPQLDWSVGEHISPLKQAAFHARANLIEQRSARQPYRVNLVNEGESLTGFGLFHRLPYGNTPNVQGNRPLYVPKPSYFAVATTRNVLEALEYRDAVRIPDRDRAANYAYLYEGRDGRWVVALWRARGEPRAYHRPAGWEAAAVTDALGTRRVLGETLRLGPVPLLITFPAGYADGRIRHALSVLEPVDGRDRLLLALRVTDPESMRRAGYSVTATGEPVERRGRRLIGGEPVRYMFQTGVEAEQFTFTADEPGTYRLNRVWVSDDGLAGPVLAVTLNEADPVSWNLDFSELGRRLEQPGIRESSMLLNGVAQGENRISVRYEAPGNVALWTLAPVPDGPLDAAYWAPINAVQSRGFPLQSFSAVGLPLRIGDQAYATGIGTLAPAFIELSLQRAFSRFEVTVGVDAAADGRGSVVFSIFADGVRRVTSETLTGFSPPQTLVVEDLDAVSRLILRVENTEADHPDGLANWVDAKLYPQGVE